ncbi:mitochondrial protein C2orf69-like [Uloborus diversus]|uniref:mitochondrial protein C2orf69-like n=1 Tax=Uloborus diversus TaxID=327109 RepID=UPI00240A9C06|nr:mitochondrial protein C2orf69-like [Uloborus diversus]
MLNHRDNKYHAKRDLESTAVLLHERFPQRNILIIKPVKMALMTFSCYENFLEVNNFGAPTYKFNYDCLKHLRMLLQNVEPIIKSQQNLECRETISTNILASGQKILVGFSKGCVVLNQLLYAFTALNETPDCEIETLVRSIESMYWLDGGHSGASCTWVTEKNVLHNFSKLKVDVHIHVTPYQVLCDTRPRIGQEEKKFRESLSRLGVNVKRVLHFENEVRSLDMHFKILDVFESVAED